jgi:nitrite reductase (NO-forming)
VAFGLVWAVDALLKWSPEYRGGFATMLDAAAKGQPGWLGPWFDMWTDLPHRAATILAYGSAATETFVAVALLIGFARKSLYLLGAGYSLMIWATGEGFGGPYHSGSTDVGAAIIYALVFAFLLVADRPGPDPYSVDFCVEKHISWWDRIAEVESPEERTRTIGTDPDAGTGRGRPRTAVRVAADGPDDD